MASRVAGRGISAFFGLKPHVISVRGPHRCEKCQHCNASRWCRNLRPGDIAYAPLSSVMSW